MKNTDRLGAEKLMNARRYLVESYYAMYGGWEDAAAGKAHQLLGQHLFKSNFRVGYQDFETSPYY